MVAKKPRIVIVGAGMAGLTAAKQIYASSEDMFELCVVEGGTRIGGRINTSEFGGDRIEMGATWIHGIGGSPVHEIAQQIHSLESDQPWECMDGFLDEPKTVAEGGFEVDPSLVESTSTLFKNLMDYAQGKSNGSELEVLGFDPRKVAAGKGKLSVGSFLKEGLDAYWECLQGQEEVKGCRDWSGKLLERAVFAIHENTQRTYTSAGDLMELNFDAEREYRMFPGEEITIAKGYISIIESLASVLPRGLIQLGRKVEQIKWQAEGEGEACPLVANGHANRPVKLHFDDGSVMQADHVILTVSLGVLKAGITRASNMFSPPLPHSKIDAISKLGYGLVNKLFLQLSTNGLEEKNHSKFPLLQLAFHPPDSDLRLKQIPWWMRKTASLCPIYKNSSVLLSWFAGEEAHKLESLPDEEIIKGVSTTLSCFPLESPNPDGRSNGSDSNSVMFTNVVKTKWGSDPLFLGSYSYIAVDSSGKDIDKLAEPLPKIGSSSAAAASVLQVLFAGEATHRTHYSTTHGAYFSGLREANRLLQYYHCL